MKKVLFLFAAAYLACICSSSPAIALSPNPCFSSLATADLELRVPAMSFAGNLYLVSFDYHSAGPTAESATWFKVSGITASTLTTCSYPAPLFIDAGKAILRVPMALYSHIPFWTELEYVPSTEGQIWFKLRNLGLMANQVFVTSSSGTGNLSTWPEAGGMTGLAAGDAVCQARATAAGLPGAFRAWLSDDTSDAYCRVQGFMGKKAANCGQAALPVAGGPWVRTDGFPFAQTLADISVRGQIFVPLDNNESGVPIPGNGVWTGTGSDGVVVSTDNCSQWSGASSSIGAIGAALFTRDAWTFISNYSCSSILPLFCFQSGSGQLLPPFVLPGKKVFLSSSTGTGNLQSWPDSGGNAGLAAGDAICRARATAGGLANASNFKAWLSTDSVNAGDRITSNGPWVRLDGVKVADTKAALLSGGIFAPINLDDLGFYYANWGRLDGYG